MEEQHDLLAGTDMPFSPKLTEGLRTAAIWARLGAILSFISIAFSILENLARGNFFTILLSVAVNVILAVYLLNFGRQTKKGIDNTDQGELELGLDSLRRYFKTLVIIILIVIGLVFIALLFVFAFSSGSLLR